MITRDLNIPESDVWAAVVNTTLPTPHSRSFSGTVHFTVTVVVKIKRCWKYFLWKLGNRTMNIPDPLLTSLLLFCFFLTFLFTLPCTSCTKCRSKAQLHEFPMKQWSLRNSRFLTHWLEIRDQLVTCTTVLLSRFRYARNRNYLHAQGSSSVERPITFHVSIWNVTSLHFWLGIMSL